MATLTPSQVSFLKSKGWTPSKINAYQSGTGNIRDNSLMNMQLRESGNSRTSGGGSDNWNAPTGQTGTIWDDPDAMDNYVNGGGISNPGDPLIVGSERNYGVPGIVTGIGNGIGNILKNIGGQLQIGAFGKGNPLQGFNKKTPTTTPTGGGGGIFANTIPGSPATQPPSAKTNNSLGAPKKSTTAGGGFEYPGYNPDPAFPDLPEIEIPVITPRDFTDQARGIADGVFAPVLASLDQSKTNIGQQGERSRQVLSGLYSNMVNDIATQAAQSAQEYAGRQTDQTQRGQALSSGIAEGYNNQNNQTAQLAKSLGLEAAVPAAQADSSSDAAWQQGMAQQNTQAMNDYWAKQGQGEQDLAANRKDVANTSGAVSQENNLNNVAQMLAGVDQNIAGVQTDKARTALDIANNLTNQDLSAQTSNAGYSMQGQSAQQDALLKAWQAAAQNNQGLNAYNIGRYGAEQNYNQQQIDNAYKQAQLDIDTAGLAAKANSAGAGAGTLSLDDYSGPGKARASLQNTYGEKGASLANLAQQVFTTSRGPADNNMNQFITDVFSAGHAQGQYTDDELRTAAMTMWAALQAKG